MAVFSGTTPKMVINFEDEDGTGITPSSATYSIYHDDEVVVEDVSFTPDGATHTLTISADYNTLDDDVSEADGLFVVVFIYNGLVGEIIKKYRIINV